MKKLIVLLAIFASGFVGTCLAQTKVVALQGVIELTPDKVLIPSTNEYVYLARTGTTYSLFISKNSELYERFSQKGNDSVIWLQGAVFKPLQHYTKKQWKELAPEIKKFFPSISYKELENMEMYLLFNYSVEEKKEVQSSPAPTPTLKKSNPKVGSDGLPIQ